MSINVNWIRARLASLGRFAGLGFSVLAITNLYLAYKSSSVATRVHDVTNHVEVVSYVTNYVNVANGIVTNSMSRAYGVSAESVIRDPVEVARCRYHYFKVGYRIGALMHGRYYYDGSPCSYGRISSVWPDRIILDNGDYISNVIPEWDDRVDRMARNKRINHD